MDDVDRTTARQEHEDRALLKASKKPEGPKPKGFCHWCNAPIQEAFCDSECRDDWEYENLRKRVNGK